MIEGKADRISKLYQEKQIKKFPRNKRDFRIPDIIEETTFPAEAARPHPPGQMAQLDLQINTDQ